MYLLLLVLQLFKPQNVNVGTYPFAIHCYFLKVELNLEPLLETNQVRIQSLCKLTGKTSVEMEALTAASVAI